ncbi:MAG: carboxylating nicotinate-nucleotide diphosphorylase [Planctomycetaceae bacterium]
MGSPALTPAELNALRRLIDWSLTEDLGWTGDVTTLALIGPHDRGRVHVVAREPGVLAGGVVLAELFGLLDPAIAIEDLIPDGSPLVRGTVVARLSGPLRALLTGERTALNFLLRLSGVATLTARFVAQTAGTRAGIYDTRKTFPGWRLLDKYAVRAGGGRNHRIGLYDQILIKDNHLAGWQSLTGKHTLAGAVERSRELYPHLKIEIEVDTLTQLEEVLPAHPDIVLLDNMTTAQLADAVALRNRLAPQVELEASGGVHLQTVAAIAKTGVERISVGGLTHSAPALDLAFDWGD